MRSVFRDNLKSYLLMAALGILAGLAVVFFMGLPDNRLWAFYDWSARTFGFWAFSTSLIVFFSESKKCAAINAGTYIFLMFLITTADRSLHAYQSGVTPFASLAELAVNSVGGWLAYSIPPALGCAALGSVLWFGRENTAWGKALRLMPAVFILVETAALFYSVWARQTRLFSALSDLICLLAYAAILLK